MFLFCRDYGTFGRTLAYPYGEKSPNSRGFRQNAVDNRDELENPERGIASEVLE
jgi:hypothetical protein